MTANRYAPKSRPATTRPPPTARHLGPIEPMVTVGFGPNVVADGPDSAARLGVCAHHRGAVCPGARGPGDPHGHLPGRGVSRLVLLRRRCPLDRGRPRPERRLRLDP